MIAWFSKFTPHFSELREHLYTLKKKRLKFVLKFRATHTSHELLKEAFDWSWRSVILGCYTYSACIEDFEMNGDILFYYWKGVSCFNVNNSWLHGFLNLSLIFFGFTWAFVYFEKEEAEVCIIRVAHTSLELLKEAFGWSWWSVSSGCYTYSTRIEDFEMNGDITLFYYWKPVSCFNVNSWLHGF